MAIRSRAGKEQECQPSSVLNHILVNFSQVAMNLMASVWGHAYTRVRDDTAETPR